MDLRSVTTKKARKKVELFLLKHSGELHLELVDRDRAHLSVRGFLWKYEINDLGNFISRQVDASASHGLRACAFFRAAEAVLAVRNAHKQAVARAQERAASDPLKVARKQKLIRARHLKAQQLSLKLG